MALSNIFDIRFLRRLSSREQDMESTMVRVGLLRKLLDDAERLQMSRKLRMPQHITPDDRRELDDYVDRRMAARTD